MEGRAPIQMKALLPYQRDIMVKILRLAIEDYYESQIVPLYMKSKLKPKSRKNSPRLHQNSIEKRSSPSKESKAEMLSKAKTQDLSLLRSKSSQSELMPPSVAPCQSGIKLLRDDYVIPQKSLWSCYIEKDLRSGDTDLNLLLGTSQIILSRDPEAYDIVEVIPIYVSSQSDEILDRSFRDVKVSHPQDGHVKLTVAKRKYSFVLENDMEAGYLYDKLREVLEGRYSIQKISELMTKREAADQAPALKVEELALVEEEFTDVKRRLELLIVKRNELRREMKTKRNTNDLFQNLETQEQRLVTLNRSNQNANYVLQDETLRRYGLDLLSPKALDRMKDQVDREIVLTQNSYGEQLVMKRETVQNLKNAFSSPQKYRPKQTPPNLDYSFSEKD